MKKRDELIHKEKLEVAATLQAAASAASNVHHPFTFPHPAVMSAHLPWWSKIYISVERNSATQEELELFARFFSLLLPLLRDLQL